MPFVRLLLACMQLFWAALYELSPANLRNFLRNVLRGKNAPRVDADELLYGLGIAAASNPPAAETNSSSIISNTATCTRTAGATSSSASVEDDPPPVIQLRFLPPTAVAMLSADATEITVFPELRALSIPRYSSLRVMLQHLQPLLLPT